MTSSNQKMNYLKKVKLDADVTEIHQKKLNKRGGRNMSSKSDAAITLQ